MDTKSLSDKIEAYIEDHQSAWSPSTLKSEASRLRSVKSEIDKGPKHLFIHLNSLGVKPYTIKTTFIRVCSLEAWCGFSPEYRTWMKKHQNKFKHAYEKEEVTITYEEAVKRIQSLEAGVREHGLGLLETGLRLNESYVVTNGTVRGKGQKPRKIFGTIKETVPKSTLWRKLKAVGLKPHMLRKLCATRLAEKGASAADLMKVFGWSDIRTASVYLQAKDEERLKSLMAESQEG